MKSLLDHLSCDLELPEANLDLVLNKLSRRFPSGHDCHFFEQIIPFYYKEQFAPKEILKKFIGEVRSSKKGLNLACSSAVFYRMLLFCTFCELMRKLSLGGPLLIN